MFRNLTAPNKCKKQATHQTWKLQEEKPQPCLFNKVRLWWLN